MSNIYKFKTTPYAHQKKALKKILKQGYGGALLMEPRTGKTKTAIDWMSILNQQKKITRVLIVAPNRVLGVWLAELHAHCPRRFHVTVWNAKDRKTRTVPPSPPGYELYILVVNYEAFATPGKLLTSGRRSSANGRIKNRALIYRWLKGETAAMILDESHKIKSPSGKASNMIVTMRPVFPFRLILTGTPLTKAKRAQDIYMQWQFLNPKRFKDLPTVSDFRERYAVWRKVETRSGQAFPKFIRPRNMAELHSRIAKDSYIVRRDQCFDLPPREHLVLTVPLATETRRVYNEMAKEMVANISEGVVAEASIVLVQALRLSQITSGYAVDDEGELHRIGFEKAKALEELLDEEFEKEQKVVVCARWKPDLDLIEAMVKARDVPCWSIRGGIKREVTDKNIVEFRECEGSGVMVVQPAAGSLGIDLSTASHMVWYSHTQSWVDFSQACDRIALSRTSTTFTHIVAESSVDELLLNTLAIDGNMGRAILSSPNELITGSSLDVDDFGRLKGVGLSTRTPKGTK